jgi:hypothetical protein
MTATIHNFPSQRMTIDQIRDRRIHHNQALLDLLEKPQRSACNLYRQVAQIIPATCGHQLADDFTELVAQINTIKATIDDLTNALACDVLKLELERKDSDVSN